MSVAYNPKIVTNGLVLALDAGNTKSYPGSGTTWTDLSGGGNNGTLTNGVEPVKQNSIVLDGSGDFLTLTNLNATYLSNDFCIESWVYVTSQANQTLFNTIPHASFDINLNRGGSGQTALYIGNGSGWQTLDFRSSGTLTANQWHHIAVTRNSNVITIWHNGISQGSTSAYMPTGFGTSAYIGTYNGGTGENVNGKIYGYRIVSGSPVYTQTFTPPIRVSNISGTQLIVAQDGGVINSAQTSVVATPSGNTYANFDSSHMKFDGTDKYINGSLPTVSAGASVTIEAFIKLNDVTLGTTKDIINQGRSGITFSYGMIIYGNNLAFRNSNGDYVFSSPTALTTGIWYHLVLSSSGSVTTGYCNGINQGTAAVGVTTNSIADYHISRRSSNSASEFMNGNIALIRVYNNRAFTSAEVQQNFNATRGRYGI